MGDVILKYGWFSKQSLHVLIILGILLALTSYGFYRVIVVKGKDKEQKSDKKDDE
jgi:flagellar basal body-associated protein FliL